MIQGSDEWRQARLGKLGASQVADALARTKTGWGASRANLMADLIVERLTGVPTEGYVSAAMQYGIDHEAEARASYEFYRSVTVAECGFIPHPSIAMTGASPDGLIGDDGLVEIKVPLSATHLDTLLSGKIPSRYVTQMTWQMICTRRKWCDFVSYDPRMPERHKLFVKTLLLDHAAAEAMQGEVIVFLTELDDKLAALDGKGRTLREQLKASVNG